jgi:hypothetical protein
LKKKHDSLRHEGLSDMREKGELAMAKLVTIDFEREKNDSEW